MIDELLSAEQYMTENSHFGTLGAETKEIFFNVWGRGGDQKQK